ncbi:MAG: PAS domain S-box protein [Deltaproteobacteria bacterium]|jgi:two-component system nitrogen regulation sensor histidine kinase NtrY|nr:PAS domain S-box protein [Deltaproteobacteria bacterium]
MFRSVFKKHKSLGRDADSKRRRREVILIIVIIFVVALLTFIETRTVRFSADIPVSNTILMFTLININLLLLILLIFLVFRNLVKLLYDRRRKVMGAKLRTRLVVAFIVLTIVPTVVLFFFSINFITTSLEFWFNVPIEQALENSLRVGGRLYDRVAANNQFFLERISYQLKSKDMLSPKKQNALVQYIQVVQREFNFDGVEVYGANTQRITYAIASDLKNKDFGTVSAENLQKEIPGGGIWTITQEIPSGELIKTIGTVPFGVKAAEAQGFVVLTVLIPPDLYENLESISHGFEEYQQIKLYKKPIQITYYISLSIVALLVLFCAIWFGFYLAKTISIPIKELAEGTRRVAEGELSFTIGSVADDEIGSLVDSFNKMTRDLRTGREQLELSTRMLKEQNIEIEEKRHYIEFVLKSVSAGVVTLDADGMVSTINKSAEKMLGVKSEEVLYKSFNTLLKVPNQNLADEIMTNLSFARDATIEVPLRLTIQGRPRSLLVTVRALKDDAGQHMGIVMVFDDLTEMEKGQRMAAWREVARRIAHEVKNPLTPITLSAQRLKRKYSKNISEAVFDECTQTIIDHVDLIRNLVNEFSSFARFPSANPKPCGLLPIIEETLALYREGHPNIKFELHNTGDIPLLNLDRQQIKQAFINLIDNAIGAIRKDGTISLDITHDSILKRIRIEVADNGPGINNEDKTRLFEPNFSTKKAGMGLGLTIVSTIIADHNGFISVQDNVPQGAKFVIELPA